MRQNTKNSKKNNTRPPSPYAYLGEDEWLKVFANMIIDRVIEEENLYKERLKIDPNAKRIYETCQCEKCVEKRSKKTATKVNK